MAKYSASTSLFFCVATLVAGFQANLAQADLPGITQNGWYTWQVTAVADAPEMCCFEWRRDNVTRRRCDLDGRNGGFDSSDYSAIPGADMQIYAYTKNGNVSRVRALSSSCPVTASSAIVDIGPVSSEDSIDWLQRLISGGSNISSSAITAIAVHSGDKARDVLMDTATNSDNYDDREDAIFWMAEARISETADVIKRFIFDDTDADIREHAAFAYSQSNAADVAEVLVQQGRNDIDPNVRSQAWFWLAQTEAAESETEILQAILIDEDDDVREEAVFALSQLPEKRAVKALAMILEDRQMNIDVRENALFWLAQTESEAAFEYIDRLLSID